MADNPPSVPLPVNEAWRGPNAPWGTGSLTASMIPLQPWALNTPPHTTPLPPTAQPPGTSETDIETGRERQSETTYTCRRSLPCVLPGSFLHFTVLFLLYMHCSNTGILKRVFEGMASSVSGFLPQYSSIVCSQSPSTTPASTAPCHAEIFNVSYW